MSDHPNEVPGPPGTNLPASTGQTAVAEAGSTTHLPDRFVDPGLAPHVHRLSDSDPAAAKRAERQVATMFGLSMLSTLVFIVAYFAIDYTEGVFLPGLGEANLLHVVLGVSMAMSLFFIGIGAVHWAKTLMSDEEVVEERHLQRSSDANRAKAVGIINQGVDSTQLPRRPVLKYSMGGALALFALPFLLQVAGSMGNPTEVGELEETIWDVKPNADGSPGTPIRLMTDPELVPIKASSVTIGSVFHVLPESFQKPENHNIEERAKAAVILMRLDPAEFQGTEGGQKARSWGYEGIVAYSKICTHVGCAVGLYEQQTHHLLCPCHQSTFDVTNDCEVIFGPAKRPLPQLKITVDADGYLVAPQGFTEAVGPSFWQRT